MKEPSTKQELITEIGKLETKLDNIISYMKENPKSDPNAYELNDVMFDFASIGNFGRLFEDTPYAFSGDEDYQRLSRKFYTIYDYRLPQLISDKQGLYAYDLYEYFIQAKKDYLTLNNPANLEEIDYVQPLFNSICGVNLFIHQQARQGEKTNNPDIILWDNEFELESTNLKLMEYKENSNNLPRPFDMRDGLIYKMQDENVSCYKKTLQEVVDAKNNYNTK